MNYIIGKRLFFKYILILSSLIGLAVKIPLAINQTTPLPKGLLKDIGLPTAYNIRV